MGDYDQLTRDLAFKAGDDTVAAIERVMSLHADPAAHAMIAMMATGQAFGMVVGLMAGRMGGTAEAVADVLWEKMRPIVVDAAKARAERG